MQSTSDEIEGVLNKLRVILGRRQPLHGEIGITYKQGRVVRFDVREQFLPDDVEIALTPLAAQ